MAGSFIEAGQDATLFVLMATFSLYERT